MRATAWPRRRRFRNPLGAVATLATIAVLTVLTALVWPPSDTLTGSATAVDGDTLRLGETRIRLIGLDAVELDQTCVDGGGTNWNCGREAKRFLAGLVAGATTSCASDGRDRYRRVLAHCKAGDKDLGDQIVRDGWAVAELEYGLALAEAQLNGRGIWSGTFDDPARWRADRGTDGFNLWNWFLGLIRR